MSKACYRHIDNVYGLNTYDYGARQYNPVTARWDRIDRFCEKYYNISPYTYCANNPVRFVDIHGDSIYISNGNECVLYVEGMEYNGKNKYIMQTISALNEILKYGKQTLLTLMTSNKSINIKKGHNRFEPEKRTQAQAMLNDGMTGTSLKGNRIPVGCGGTVYWNPSEMQSGPNTKEATTRPAFVGLAHELGHAYSAYNGTANYTVFDSNFYNKEFRYKTYDEFNAMHYENIVRGNAGLPLRTAYGEYNTPIFFMPIPNINNER